MMTLLIRNKLVLIAALPAKNILILLKKTPPLEKNSRWKNR
jgi:hypothetical protein